MTRVSTTLAELYELLATTSVLADEERDEWLTRYERLPASAQHELYRTLKDAEKEFQKEEEAHTERLAEIGVKHARRLKGLAKDHKLKMLAPSTPTQSATTRDPLEDILDEDFIRQLNETDSF